MADEEEIEEFIRTFLNGVEEGLGNKYEVKGDIDFEIAVAITKKVGGGFKIFVVDAEGKYSKEKLSKVKFKVKKKPTKEVTKGMYTIEKV